MNYRCHSRTMTQQICQQMGTHIAWKCQYRMRVWHAAAAITHAKNVIRVFEESGNVERTKFPRVQLCRSSPVPCNSSASRLPTNRRESLPSVAWKYGKLLVPALGRVREEKFGRRTDGPAETRQNASAGSFDNENTCIACIPPAYLGRSRKYRSFNAVKTLRMPEIRRNIVCPRDESLGGSFEIDAADEPFIHRQILRGVLPRARRGKFLDPCDPRSGSCIQSAVVHQSCGALSHSEPFMRRSCAAPPSSCLRCLLAARISEPPRDVRRTRNWDWIDRNSAQRLRMQLVITNRLHRRHLTQRG